MSIATEITRLQNAKSALKTAINAKNDAQHQIDDETLEDYATFVGDIQNGAYNVESVVDGDFQDLNITDYDYTPTTTTPTASATATSGVTYTHILSQLTFAEINRYAKAISNSNDIDSTTANVYITDGSNHFVLSVGDTICYTLSNDEFMIDQIIGFNHDDLTTATAYGETTTTGKAGITFQMENCLSTLYPMNDTNTNAGGWGASKMRTTTLPAVKLTMPAELQSIIKYVNKKAVDGGSTNYTTTETLSDDLFLLAEIEIFGSITYAQDGTNEGMQYVYWAAHNTANDRIKYYDNAETPTATTWWERSSNYSNTSNCCIVSITGNAYSINANASLGVAFGFCV